MSCQAHFVKIDNGGTDVVLNLSDISFVVYDEKTWWTYCANEDEFKNTIKRTARICFRGSEPVLLKNEGVVSLERILESRLH